MAAYILEEKDYLLFAYIGDPNASIEIGNRDDLVYGEMWVPTIRK